MSNVPDFEGFARAILERWPVDDIDGGELFDLSVSYKMIAEIPGGFDPESHLDSEGIGPEKGDPWYEYTFTGGSGPGPLSVHDLCVRLEAVEAERDALREALRFYASVEDYATPFTGGWGKLYFDCGQIARAALQEGKE